MIAILNIFAINIFVMLNILYHLILKVILCSHMKIVYYTAIPLTTFMYIHNIRNNFIIRVAKCKSKKIFNCFISLGCILSSVFSS